MTVSAQTPRSGPYSGNGSTTAFDYAFLVKADTEIVVTVADAAGNETTKVLNTDYTVSGVGASAGGVVTFNTAPVSTVEVVITRVVALTQAVDLQNRKAVVPQVLEDAFDKLTRVTQDHKEQLSRSIKVDLFGNVDLATLTVQLGTVAGISGNITTLAAVSSAIPTVAAIDAAVAAVAAIDTDVSAVAAIDTAVSAVVAISAEISTVAAIDTDVSAVAVVVGSVAAVAGITADVTAVAAIPADVTAVAGVTASVVKVAAIDADVAAVSAIDAAVTTVAANVTDVTNFSDVYSGPVDSDPALRTDGSALQAGDLYFNTSSNSMKVYSGTAWAVTSSSAVGMVVKTKTADYIVDNNEFIVADTSGGAWTLTLPPSPDSGDRVVVADGADWSANNLTVARNGSTIEGDAQDLVMDIGGVSVEFVFAGTTWQLYMQVGAISGTPVTETGTQTLTNKTLTSVVLDGTPTAPTAAAATDTTQVATTAFVRDAIPNVLNASGSAPIYACRAWVNFDANGTLSISGSGNVSSVTDNGSGDFTVNFSTDMQDTNYAVAGSASDLTPVVSLCPNGNGFAVGSIRVGTGFTANGSGGYTKANPSFVSVAVFR